MLRVLTLIATLSLSVTMLLATSSPASAHERRTIGPYQVAVGFLNEPAFAGNTNGVDLTVSDPRSTPPKMVEGVEKTLSVDIYSGGLTTPLHLSLATRFGLPGKYAAYFIPTRPGSFRFVFTGKIEQQDVKETFESGPGRFNDVEDVAALQYPTKVPEAASLSDRLDAIDRDLGSLRAIALAAVALAIVIPIGTAFVTRRRA